MAIDPDQPLNESGVRYSLDPDTNPNGSFMIDSHNGSITAIKPIDREITSVINLRILVIYTVWHFHTVEPLYVKDTHNKGHLHCSHGVYLESPTVYTCILYDFTEISTFTISSLP